jgi:hypothetical protein
MKKVKIIPTIAFANGKRFEAHFLSMTSAYDNLFNHVVFRYKLYCINGVEAGESTFELKDDAYREWDTTPEHAYKLCLEAISLECQPRVGGEDDKTYSMFEE